ncbi:MAG: hypothetical protein N2544_06050 [Burkholderiales bacterium]|nr:hypothetical protein [Burkholderiales bacterium]
MTNHARRAFLIAGAAALVAALPAAAQQEPAYGPPRGEPGGPGPMHREYRGEPGKREFRYPDDPYRHGRRGGAMTPDERRQLRRDIDDAGRDLYRDRPDRPGKGGRGWR